MLGLQHVVTLDIRLQHIAVAPPRGVRGLKFEGVEQSWDSMVAPPRGVRGLKLYRLYISSPRYCRTPSWGAWIEIFRPPSTHLTLKSHPLVGCVD